MIGIIIIFNLQLQFETVILCDGSESTIINMAIYK